MVSSIGGGRARIVYCEGVKGGIDALLLNALLKPTPAHAARVEIEPIGGKASWSKFFDVYAQEQRLIYAALGDRDFDKEPLFDAADRPQLQQRRLTRAEYLTGLPNIESYFLNPALLRRYLVEERSLTTVTDADLTASLGKIAEDLTYYMAARWALAALRWEMRETSPLGDISAVLLAEADCLRAAEECISRWRAQTAGQIHTANRAVTRARFDAAYAAYRAQFTSPDFLSSRQFVAWFDGKDLLGRWLGALKVNVTTKAYMEWAVNKLDFEQFLDLIAFRDLCWQPLPTGGRKAP